MAQRFAVYVPTKSAANLRRGLQHGVWGWEDSALDRKQYRSVFASLRAGDLVLLATGGGDPRNLGEVAFARQGLREVHILRATGSAFRDLTPLWDDAGKVFPNRIRTEFLRSVSNWGLDELGPAAMKAFKLSANSRGVLVRINAALLPFE